MHDSCLYSMQKKFLLTTKGIVCETTKNDKNKKKCYVEFCCSFKRSTNED